MADAVTIPEKKLDRILSALEELKREVVEVKEKLDKSEPPYGSDEWWEWSMKKSEEDYKAGRYKTFKTVEQLQKHLDSLK